MKHIAAISMLLLPFSMVFAQGKGPYTKITSQEAKSMIDKGNVTIVDVRTQSEYDADHLQEAVLVPLQTIEQDAPAVLTDKNAVLLVYCRTGIRSAAASKKLISMGYLHVYDIAGGITSWPYSTVNKQVQK